MSNTRRRPAKPRQDAQDEPETIHEAIKPTSIVGVPEEARPARWRSPGAIRDTWVEAFWRLGGIDALTEWARNNPDEYYRTAAKLLPRAIEVDTSQDLATLLAACAARGTPPPPVASTTATFDPPPALPPASPCPTE